jgi:List-Bact-rpt repeat protein
VHAAPSPVTWCGGTPSPTDLPDVVGGDQIHVVYAVPSDGTDRFTELATAIAADVGAIGDWWRTQDATRAPRFDLAAFGCSGPGSLDISDVRLPHPTAYYNGAAPRLQLLRDDLVAAGFDEPAKKYLVYYDQQRPAAGTDCGSAYVNADVGGEHGYAAVYVAPNLGGCGAVGEGSYLALVAAHELVSALGALAPATPGPPHRCAGDPLHVCDGGRDVLAPRPAAASLATAILDRGHDDYYAHAGGWWDVQDSPWLRRLDQGELPVRVVVGSGGADVAVAGQPSVTCASASRCGWTWPAEAKIALVATAASGYRLARWGGCPAKAAASCTFTVDAPARVTAVFVPVVAVVRFHVAFSADRTRLTATLRTLPARAATAVDCTFGRLASVTASAGAGGATCAWRVPARFRGHRIAGLLELRARGEVVLAKRFRVRVPQR